MLSRFFGKSDKFDDSQTKETQHKRGHDAAEDNPDTAWREWGSGLTAQDAGLPFTPEAVAVPPQPVQANVPVTAVSAQPQITQVDFELITERMPLEEPMLTMEQRKNNALGTVERHHQRIANTIRTLWGYKECAVYINKLIMAGGDGMGHARVGFNQDAVQAMLELSDLHDAEYGPPDAPSTGLGLSI